MQSLSDLSRKKAAYLTYNDVYPFTGGAKYLTELEEKNELKKTNESKKIIFLCGGVLLAYFLIRGLK